MCLQQKKRVRVPKALGSNVENGFGVIFLHANEIIMRAWSGYQKQALHLSSVESDAIENWTHKAFSGRPSPNWLYLSFQVWTSGVIENNF